MIARYPIIRLGSPQHREVEIILASDEAINEIRSLWREYWDSLALPPDFQNFAEECRTLPGMYAPPKGRLLIALMHGRPAGTAALRPLSGYACEGNAYTFGRYTEAKVSAGLFWSD